MKSAFIAAALGLVFTASAIPASAEPSKKDDSYGYEFSDDPLAAENKGAVTAQIRVLAIGRRDRLLRPRVHFVSEMLKSVENM